MKQTLSRRNTLHFFARAVRLGMPLWLVSFTGSVLTVSNSYLSLLVGGLLMRAAVDFRSDTLLHDFLSAALLFCGSILLYGVGSVLNVWGAFRIRERIQVRITCAWMRRPEQSAAAIPSGDVMTRFTQDIAELEDFYFQGFAGIVISPFLNGIAALVTVWVVHPVFTCIALTAGLFGAFWHIAMAGRVRQRQTALRKNASRVTQAFTNLMTGATAIRLGNMTAFMRARAAHADTEQVSLTRRAAVLSGGLSLASGLLTAAGMIGSFLFGLYGAQVGLFPLADVFLVLPMLPLVANMLSSIGSSFGYLTRLGVSVERVCDILDGPTEETRSHLGNAFPTEHIDPAAPYLSMRDGTFQYTDAPILTHVDITIERGQTVALIGPSGSGKSTILHLMLGLYSLSSGSIALRGVDFSDCSLRGWRSQFAFVPQQSPMLNDSVFENIAIGLSDEQRQTLSAEEQRARIEQAAKQAGAHAFICALPEGYDTKAGEAGERLSGGERQRIALARAFVRDADILLLDEPTSALDAESEALITQALKQCAGRKTVLLSAHKLNTVQHADRIYVLSGGTVAEGGTHAELIQARGVYYELWEAQAASRKP